MGTVKRSISPTMRTRAGSVISIIKKFSVIAVRRLISLAGKSSADQK